MTINPLEPHPSPAETFDLAGGTVVVTGASGGIGQAICRHLAGAGAQLVVVHEPGAMPPVGGEPGVRSFICDLADGAECEDRAGAMAEAVGPVRALVNAAGVMSEEPLASLSVASWHRTMAINLTAPFLLSKALLPNLMASGAGSIVNLSSDLAYRGGANLAAYTASKAGLLGLTRSLARELAPHIRVNAVAPGPIDTPMTAPFATDEWVRAKEGQLALGRLGAPDEVAPCVLFLVSGASSYLTGQTINPNGGGSMP